MADGDFENRARHERLWDRDGSEWTTKWATWASAKQAASFAGRDQGIAVSNGPGEALDWLSADAASEWWCNAKNHFEVPGHAAAIPDASGSTWGAHIYRRGADRLLVVEAFC